MALFKTFRGKRTDLDKVPKVDGHAYFCTDDGSFWIDYTDGISSIITRKQINKDSWTADIEEAVAILRNEMINKTDYLGTISSPEDLSTIAGNGDYYRVSKEFQFGNEIAHIGDILVSLINFPAQTPEYWDLIHLEDRVQPDWEQTDMAAADFIKNKPILAPIAISGLIEDLEISWDTMLIFDGGDAGSHEPIALVGTTKLV